MKAAANNCSEVDLRSRVQATLRRVRNGSGRSVRQARDGSLAERISTLADDLAAVIDDAAELRLMAPTPVTNGVLDLRAWSVRLFEQTTIRPTTVDATRLLAYIRALPDQQLLALLADLPWPRLDALLDAVQMRDRASSREG